ncbi:hypothetical protein GQ600_24118 [Phytophthora cactorum]|nr:hypothetical protein GQ600_24118 [Phytophthora cactorum]
MEHNDQPVGPTKVTSVQVTRTKRSVTLTLSIAAVPSVQHIASLRKILATLFTLECMILAEYIEFIIPLLYGNYVLMMVHLPSDDITQSSLASLWRMSCLRVYGVSVRTAGGRLVYSARVTLEERVRNASALSSCIRFRDANVANPKQNYRLDADHTRLSSCSLRYDDILQHLDTRIGTDTFLLTGVDLPFNFHDH